MTYSQALVPLYSRCAEVPEQAPTVALYASEEIRAAVRKIDVYVSYGEMDPQTFQRPKKEEKGQIRAILDELLRFKKLGKYGHPRDHHDRAKWGELLNYLAYQQGAISINQDPKKIAFYKFLTDLDRAAKEYHGFASLRILYVLIEGFYGFADAELVDFIDAVGIIGREPATITAGTEFRFPNGDKLNLSLQALPLLYYYLVVNNEQHPDYSRYQINRGFDYPDMIAVLNLRTYRYAILDREKFDKIFSMIMLGSDVTRIGTPAVEATPELIVEIEAERRQRQVATPLIQKPATSPMAAASARQSPVQITDEYLAKVLADFGKSSPLPESAAAFTPVAPAQPLPLSSAITPRILTPTPQPSATQFTTPLSAAAPVLTTIRLQELWKTNIFFMISRHFADSTRKITPDYSTRIFCPRLTHFADLLVALYTATDSNHLKILLDAATLPHMIDGFKKANALNPLEGQKYYNYLQSLRKLSHNVLQEQFRLCRIQLTANSYSLQILIDILRLGGLTQMEAHMQLSKVPQFASLLLVE